MSLRRTFVIAASYLGLVGVMTAVALIALTTRLRHTASDIGIAVESIRVADAVGTDLIALRNSSDIRGVIQNTDALRERIADAKHYVSGAREQQVIDELERDIDHFVTAAQRAVTQSPNDPLAIETRTGSEFKAAQQAARELIAINVDQSRALGGVAEHWDRLADLVGFSAIALLVPGIAGLAVWLHHAAFRPAVRLAKVIERYANGERGTRSREDGPVELRLIAHEFNEMAAHLDRQRRSQLAFLAGVAHDLRNPLGALRVATSMIAPDEPLPSEDRVRQLFARVDRQISRLDRMIYDLLDASRIESGNLELQVERCDMRDVVQATIELFEPSAPSHQFVVEMPSLPVPLVCDPARIEQVLNNLVSNAVKYSPRGGRVGIEIEAKTKSVVVSVSDQGVGMTPEDMERLFEPFQRVTTMGTIPGVGLGLFVARRIVEAHGGTISVDSTPGSGSTFHVELPRFVVRESDDEKGVSWPIS